MGALHTPCRDHARHGVPAGYYGRRVVVMNTRASSTPARMRSATSISGGAACVLSMLVSQAVLRAQRVDASEGESQERQADDEERREQEGEPQQHTVQDGLLSLGWRQHPMGVPGDLWGRLPDRAGASPAPGRSAMLVPRP